MMVERYSTFQKHATGPSTSPEGRVVVLTISIGSLGAHILGLFLTWSDVRKVYCLVRDDNVQERVLEVLRKTGLSVPDIRCVVALTSDLSRGNFSLSPNCFRELQSEATSIIHKYISFPG